MIKLFDHTGLWLNTYESSNAPVTWSVYEFPGNTDMPTGTFSPTQGYLTDYTVTRAYNTVYMIGRFVEGTTVLADTVKLESVARRSRRPFPSRSHAAASSRQFS